jgi:RNA polymerase sigma-70 factor (ECF subfamily)
VSANGLIENFFRREYGRMVATLSRRVGVQHLELVEDAVQAALLTAYKTWTTSQPPANPPAWVFRVAYNNVLDALRRQSRRRRILAENPAPEPEASDPSGSFLDSEVADDFLRMLFVCCDERIPEASQLVLALKILCGFSVHEIAHRLFYTDANVYKRLSRARAQLREGGTLDETPPKQYATRVPAVHRVLYVMFTEGHLSLRAESAIRMELCLEAIQLGEVLAEHPAGNTPETAALLALMHLHVARMAGRQAPTGGLLLLEEQDRSTWDQHRIEEGMRWLAVSARGDVFSKYHAEAGVAAEHCLAQTFEETRWDRIAECYRVLEGSVSSPLHGLNRAIAVAQWKGPEAGLDVVERLDTPTWLTESHLWWAVLADLHRRCGHADEAARSAKLAWEAAPSPAVRDLMERRLRISPT